ncbi:DUF86 domain-containing protein [Candidatus Woesebacteria bacterium]|nr:DUF86 domain-containing protein [Candidatus Woesebacteria bacterium]
MATERDIVYLRHILLAIEKINEYVSRGGKGLYDKDTAIQDAIIKQIEIVGEASRKISKEFKGNHSEIPWRLVSGMRDKLVHDYMGVDLEAVWKTAVEDIPELERIVEEVIESY